MRCIKLTSLGVWNQSNHFPLPLIWLPGAAATILIRMPSNHQRVIIFFLFNTLYITADHKVCVCVSSSAEDDSYLLLVLLF